MHFALTGHRPNKLNNEYSLDGVVSIQLFEQLQAIIDKHSPTHLISGMALGADMIWAILAIKNNLNLIAAIPFIGQESKWPQTSVDLYNEILAYPKCVKKIVCEGGYAVWKMQKRNEWMVDNCNMLVAVWDGTDGGTANCVRYAKNKIGDEKIIRIIPPKI